MPARGLALVGARGSSQAAANDEKIRHGEHRSASPAALAARHLRVVPQDDLRRSLPLGAEVTATRIGGSGYTTFYLARVDAVRLAGVDAATAFLGSDTQDPPVGSLSLYIYARRGSNLILFRLAP